MNNIIDFLLGTYCCWKFKQIVKEGFGRKIQLNAFKFGPMT